jgi:polygalacturonase
MLRREFVSSLVLGVSAVALGQAAPPAGMKNVLDYGAKPDGKTLNTHALQRAIDEVFQAGGGMVYFPAGRFLTGRIDLKSRVGLYLGEGSTLLGSTSISDYHGDSADPGQKHLIYAKDAEEVTLAGAGSIDGQGEGFWEPSGKPPTPPDQAWNDVASHELKEKKTGRPSPMIRFANCRKVRVTGVRLANSAGWTLHALNCDDVEITRIAIRNPINGPNTDGIDLTGCQNVLVSDCTIETGDDAICLKSENPLGPEPRLVKNIKVTNCRVTTCCNGLKIGTGSEGGFENIEFSNCEVISNTANVAERVVSGIALEVVDGGWIDGIKISGIRMQQTRTPIFIRLEHRKQVHDYPQHGIRGVTIENVQATGSILASSITGLPDDRVGDVTLSNISIENVLVTRPDLISLEVPEKDHAYPEARMFGLLPASGLYVRHAGGLRMDHVTFIARHEEERPTIMLDDVDGAHISALASTAVRGAMPIVSLTNARNVTISGSAAPAGTETFVAVNGSGSANVVLSGNDLRAARHPFTVENGAPRGAVIVNGAATPGS